MSNKNNLGVASKLAQLDELVAWFDSDEFELEQALEKFKAAEALAVEIEKDLNELKNSIEIVKARFDKVSE
jgi:exodeoxyribonuclease VII small subunit